MITLEGGDEFQCPHCGHGYDVREWGTEYNDPQPGSHEVFCSKCDKKFTIDVDVVVRILARK